MLRFQHLLRFAIRAHLINSEISDADNATNNIRFKYNSYRFTITTLRKFLSNPNPSTSVYGLAAVKSNPGTAASPSNMTSTKAQGE
ncbi:hypothetical protein [Leyella stercorea]|uniref:hypothetical protein n=1 Tax=Leyella stercorea TaxID=363265 RepID=UPI00242AA7B6|nr:hypothetical protein [Leyella stercorea]